MKTGEAGKNIIKSYEKCRLVAYAATEKERQKNIWTLGWGHTRGVKQGDTCTQEQADEWLDQDIGWSEECVINALDDEPTQNQFDALVCLCYNIGCPQFTGSTLVKLMNQGNVSGAAGQFVRWNKQNGVVLDGLTRRREMERDLFLS